MTDATICGHSEIARYPIQQHSPEIAFPLQDNRLPFDLVQDRRET